MALHPLAGKPAPRSVLVNVPRLVAAYYALAARPGRPGAAGRVRHLRPPRLVAHGRVQRGAHPRDRARRSASTARATGIDGPLFVGMDTHALSEPALVDRRSRCSRRNGVERAHPGRPRATRRRRSISHAILDVQPRPHDAASPTASSSRRRTTRPRTAASSTTRPTAARPTPDVTKAIEARANALLDGRPRDVKRIAVRARAARATRRASTTTSARTSTTSRTSSTWTRSRGASAAASASTRSAARSVAYWDADRRALRARPRRS